jgi:hypothetical protein
MQNRIDTPTLLRRQLDLVDQGPYQLRRLVLMSRVLKQALQLFDLAALNRRKVRVHRNIGSVRT